MHPYFDRPSDNAAIQRSRETLPNASQQWLDNPDLADAFERFVIADTDLERHLRAEPVPDALLHELPPPSESSVGCGRATAATMTTS